MAKIGRNHPCPCGSGRKFKHCCQGSRHIVSAPPPPQKDPGQAFQTYVTDLNRNLNASISCPKTRQSMFGLMIHGPLLSLLETIHLICDELPEYENTPFDLTATRMTSAGAEPTFRDLWRYWSSLKSSWSLVEGLPELSSALAGMVQEFTTAKPALLQLAYDPETPKTRTARQLAQQSARLSEPLQGCLKDLAEFGDKVMLDACTDLLDSRTVLIPNTWFAPHKIRDNLVTLGLVYSVDRLHMGLINMNSYLMDREAGLWLSMILSQPEAASWPLEDVYRELYNHDFWRLLISIDSPVWNAVEGFCYRHHWCRRQRISLLRRAELIAQCLQTTDSGNNPHYIQQILNWLTDESATEFQDQFIKAWNHNKNRLGHSLPGFPDGHHILAALLPASAAKVLKKRHQNHRSQREKPGYKRHYRVRRSNFDPLSMESYQIEQTTRTMAGYLQSSITKRGLGFSPPSIIWNRYPSGDDEFDIIMDLESNTLQLSLSILNAPWGRIKELLRWSLAVKLSQNYLASHSQQDPESAFALAAKRMALSSTFRQPNPRLHGLPQHWREADQHISDDEQRILRKINKLFALSQSSNEAESSLAMERAQEMIRSFNIKARTSQHQTLANPNNMVSLTLYLSRKSHDPITDRISSILVNHYFVRVVFSHAWDPDACDSFATIEIVGRRHNVLLAEHVFDFLMYKAQALWQNAKKAQKLNNKLKISYQIGLLDGFRKKLDLIKQQQDAHLQNEYGLISLEDRDIDHFMDDLYPSLRSSNAYARLCLEPQGYQAGQKEGRDIRIDQPIGESRDDSSTTHLLT
jgi:hypothetical protein